MSARKPVAPTRRQYLPREDRRQALLDVAAMVVERDGWQALSMISVAEAAQVSRQLVYQHFESADTLMADTMSHLFRDRYEHIRSGIDRYSDDLATMVRIAEQQTFDHSPERVRALWQMLTATYSDNAEARRMSQRLRRLLSKLWASTLQSRFGLDPKRGQAVSWMLSMAFWGAHQLVEDGELNRAEATELFTWMLLRLHDKPPAPSPTHARKARARNRTPAAETKSR